jgi:hypothetical protein
MNWRRIAVGVMEGRRITPEEALRILATSDDELLSVLDAAFAIPGVEVVRRTAATAASPRVRGKARRNCIHGNLARKSLLARVRPAG